VEDRDTLARVSGDPNHDATFTQRWRLVLEDVNGSPWRVAAAPD